MMNSNASSSVMTQAAFFGICLMAIGWLALTILFETHLGVPATGIQWAKRLVGWAVEIWLMRTLILGIRRRRASTAK